MLTLAVDNGATVVINGYTVLTQDPNGTHYNPAETLDITSYLNADSVNTIEVTVTNLGYDTDDAHTNPAGLVYKLEIEGADCVEEKYSPEPDVESVTIVASKVVCTDESELPNWGTGSAEGLERPITETTAQNWVDTHESCSLVPGWEFQVGDQNAGDPGGGFLGIFGTGYTTFGPTNAQGIATAVYALTEGITELHLREVLQAGFIPFTFDQGNQSNDDDVSAEFYCSNDVLNYDNWDFIRGPVAGETYHCVAFNVPTDAGQCDIQGNHIVVSNATTGDEEGFASLVTDIHVRWTALINSASWIWKGTSTSNEDAADGTTEKFTKVFTIEGTPMGATLEIAADNQYSVEINGEEVCADTEEFNYQAPGDEGHDGQDTCVIAASVLHEGVNTMTFTVTNVLLNGAHDGTPTTNPAGLLYKLTIDDEMCEAPPVAQTSTVTMCKVTEGGEGWDYLPDWQLMLLGDSVGSVDVLSDGNDHTIANVPAGDYVIQANGSYIYRPGDSAASTSDAAFSLRLPSDGYAGPYAPWIEVNTFPNPYTGWLGVMLNNTLTDWGSVFNPNHLYALGTSTGTTQDFDFKILDDQYGDNSGKIAVNVNKGYYGVTDDEGCVVFNDVPFGSYTVAEVNQNGWSYQTTWDKNNDEIDGLTAVVDEAVEKFTLHNSVEGDDGEPSGGDTFKVHIFKFIEDGESVAQISNEDADGYPFFPMIANYDIAGVGTNLGAGDGYDLGDGQSGNSDDGLLYAANTISLHSGDDYGTHEVVGGDSPVVASEEQCSAGKYFLKGYKVGDTKGEAMSALVTSIAPFFSNMTDDKYVIVVNEACDDETPGEGEDTEHTTIITGDTSAGENLLGWLFNRDTGTQSPYEFNSDMPDIGTGSLQVEPITNTINGNSDKFIGELFDLTPIADLDSFSFDFKIGTPDSTVEEQFYVSVYANFGESSPTKYYDCRYNVVATIGSTGSFTTVTFDPSLAYPVTTRTGGSASPHICPASPSGMDALSTGSSTVRVFAINVGDTSGSDLGVSGYLDNVVVVKTVGSNTHTETYDFEPEEVESITPQDETSGGGSTSRTSSRRSSSSAGGEVLGATTECSALIDTYMSSGALNDSADVLDLQGFLNGEVNADLPLTGFFGPMTDAAVHTFQKKYWQDILQPWFAYSEYGIVSADDSTGVVYKTTKWKINNLVCPGSEVAPVLP